MCLVYIIYLFTNNLVLLENGHILIFWIGRQISPEFINNVFGVDSIEKIDLKLVCILILF